MSHYEERLEADVKRIRERVVAQGASVGRALHDASAALLALDRRLAARTILADHPVNRTARDVDRMCHAFVARHVPSAGHLRFVSSVMRMNIALERVGDYAVTISREVVQMREAPPAELAGDIELMAANGRRLLDEAVQAFRDSSAERARATLALARQHGRTFHRVFGDLLRTGEAGARPVEDLFGLLVVLYRLERVGDQAKNLCEETIFIATGEAKKPKVYSILFVDETDARWAPMAVLLARKAFPESGVYASAGWSPAAEVDPRVVAFLDRRGLDARGLVPRRLATSYDDLAAHHVLVGLEGDLRSHLPEVPFHSVLLEWDVPVCGSDPLSEEALDRVQRRLVAGIRDLMETLRGEGAA